MTFLIVYFLALGEIIPSLAESVEIKEDGVEYNFKIKDDIYWSDGNKITPQDIVAFFREVITEENQRDSLLNVFGVNEYLNSNKTFAETVAISATEDTVNIRLNTIDDNFLKELTKPQYRLRKSLLYWENISSNCNNIPYSGDYSVSSINKDEVVLERNNTANKELAQTIHLINDEGEDLALAAFEIGNRDVVINPPKSELERLKDENKLITMPSNRAVYLAFNMNNSNFGANVKKEIYRLMCEATEEYQNTNDLLTELAECSYFRENREELDKLQSRNVMVNTVDDIEGPNKLIMVAEETLLNKDLTDFLVNWFDENTDIVLVVNLLPAEEIDLISEKNYYDVALIDVYANSENEDQLFESISNYIPEEYNIMIKNSTTASDKEELFAEIEEDLFNNYRVLPLLFYNDTIAVNGNIFSNKDSIFDGNGNIDFTNTSNLE